MRKLVATVAVALSAAAMMPSIEVRAEEPPALAEAAARFEGSWVPVNEATARAGILSAIENVVGEMNFIKRPFARSKLRSTNQLLANVQFQFSGAQLTYTYNGGKVIRTTVNGPAVRWKSPDDKEFYQVGTTLKDRRFTQTFRGADGSKQEVFDLDSSGKSLSYWAAVSSPKLPKVLRYSYPLKRK